jgi:hypothetical protein
MLMVVAMEQLMHERDYSRCQSCGGTAPRVWCEARTIVKNEWKTFAVEDNQMQFMGGTVRRF